MSQLPPQRIILLSAFAVVLLMVLFPPWAIVHALPDPERPRVERFAGYHFLLADPTPTDKDAMVQLFQIPDKEAHGHPIYTDLQYFSTRLDSSRLTLQIVTALILAALLFFAFRPKY